MWEPILEKWSGALGLISLTAARNHFVDKLVSLDVVRSRCRSDSRNRDSPAPISPIGQRDVEFWSDSTACFHYRTDVWNKSTWIGHSSTWSKKRYPFPSALAAEVSAGGGGQLGMVAPGGTLAELLKYLETQEQADARVRLDEYWGRGNPQYSPKRMPSRSQATPGLGSSLLEPLSSSSSSSLARRRPKGAGGASPALGLFKPGVIRGRPDYRRGDP